MRTFEVYSDFISKRDTLIHSYETACFAKCENVTSDYKGINIYIAPLMSYYKEFTFKHYSQCIHDLQVVSQFITEITPCSVYKNGGYVTYYFANEENYSNLGVEYNLNLFLLNFLRICWEPFWKKFNLRGFINDLKSFRNFQGDNINLYNNYDPIKTLMYYYNKNKEGHSEGHSNHYETVVKSIDSFGCRNFLNVSYFCEMNENPYKNCFADEFRKGYAGIIGTYNKHFYRASYLQIPFVKVANMNKRDDIHRRKLRDVVQANERLTTIRWI